MAFPWVLSMVISTAASPATSTAEPSAELLRELASWRAEKDREMRGPQSPLIYVGPRRLSPGSHSLGSGATDELQFLRPGLPEHALDLVVQDVRLKLVPRLPLVALNGQPVAAGTSIDLKPGDGLEVGPLEVRYQGNATVTINDQSRPERLAYTGLHYLPTDARYRVVASFEPAAVGRTLILETSQHQQRQLALKGTLHFSLLGQPLTLEGFALSDRPDDLFVIFRDGTNGKETYGAGRFLWVKAPVNGEAIVDFNQAWNPLCAYSDGYNCPLAPPENRLTVPIPVGEAPYHPR